MFSSLFEFGNVKFDKKQYDKHFAFGVRRYLLKENDETIPAARKKVKKLYVYEVMIEVLIVTALLSIIFCNLSNQE